MKFEIAIGHHHRDRETGNEKNLSCDISDWQFLTLERLALTDRSRIKVERGGVRDRAE